MIREEAATHRNLFDKPVTKQYNNTVPKRGEIFLVKFDGVGSEQRGLRPAVILQNDIGNQCSTTVLVAPLSTKCYKHLPTHVFLSRQRTALRADSVAMMEQVRVMDKSRLLYRVAAVPEEEMTAINQALLISFGLVK